MLPRLREQWPQLKLYLREETSSARLRSAAPGTARLRPARPALRLRRRRFNGACSTIRCSSPIPQAKPRGQARSTAAEIDENRLLLLEDGHCLKDHALSACNRPELRAQRGDDGYVAAHARADGRQRPWPHLRAGHGDRGRHPCGHPRRCAGRFGRITPIGGSRSSGADRARAKPSSSCSQRRSGGYAGDLIPDLEPRRVAPARSSRPAS